MNKLQFYNKKDELILDSEPLSGWKILIVDDDPEIHQVTRLVLNRFQFDNKAIQILEAHSAEEAKAFFQNEKNISVAFIDVIMETDRAGLDLVDYVRNDLNNHTVRIIIRTGQPGIIQEQTTINNYDIDDKRAAVPAIQFYISDEGPGIPEQELELIFSKFTQSSETASGAGGTGLGLSISNEIAKLLEGKVWAENKKEKGATFNFLLPLNN